MIEHKWNGTVLTITSDSGTSSMDLKGDKGDDGARGCQGISGKSLEIDNTLSQEGCAACAKAVGESFNSVDDRFMSIGNSIGDLENDIISVKEDITDVEGSITDIEESINSTINSTKEELNSTINQKVSYTDIVDNLNSDASNLPLSAKQGSILYKDISIKTVSNCTLDSIVESSNPNMCSFYHGSFISGIEYISEDNDIWIQVFKYPNYNTAKVIVYDVRSELILSISKLNGEYSSWNIINSDIAYTNIPNPAVINATVLFCEKNGVKSFTFAGATNQVLEPNWNYGLFSVSDEYKNSITQDFHILTGSKKLIYARLENDGVLYLTPFERIEAGELIRCCLTYI